MHTTTAQDITKSTGRKLASELETKKCVKVQKSEKTYTHNEVWAMGESILEEVFSVENVKFK